MYLIFPSITYAPAVCGDGAVWNVKRLRHEMPSSGSLRCVALVRTDLSVDNSASILCISSQHLFICLQNPYCLIHYSFK
jgi:hypothetical protein